MLGVITAPEEECVVREFFELFKTPWEFHRSGRRYDVVLCAGDAPLDDVSAKLLLVYSGRKTAFDAKRKVQIQSQRQGAALSLPGSDFPIYGSLLTFRHEGAGVLTEKQSTEPAAYVDPSGEMVFARVGYDLFDEVRTILVKGQPAANAAIPALELHIGFLRDLIAACGISFVEIPPAPDGYPFIACLTHDLDHPSIRLHKFDATILGFLYRATAGSAVKVARGRLSLKKLLTNCVAAAKLPLIHLGLAKDFWYEFDRYLEIEKGRPATFFVIPFARFPGRSANGAAPRARGAAYGVLDIAGKIQLLSAAGSEIGLHGIDAWIDSSRGRAEGQRISEASGAAALGVRMHWLYSDEKSPSVLEEAGFAYDSTVGYNQTVGYRAGTGQAFKPLQANHLLELPLHVMDSALFYPGYLNLLPAEAWERLTPIFENAARYGGAVTVNWHDRSIAPERLWGDFYIRMLDELSARGACFSTAGHAVSWFRKRRSVVFEQADGGRLRVNVPAESAESNAKLPALRLRSHKARTLMDLTAAPAALGRGYVDTAFNESIDISSPN